MCAGGGCGGVDVESQLKLHLPLTHLPLTHTSLPLVLLDWVNCSWLFCDECVSTYLKCSLSINWGSTAHTSGPGLLPFWTCWLAVANVITRPCPGGFNAKWVNLAVLAVALVGRLYSTAEHSNSQTWSTWWLFSTKMIRQIIAGVWTFSRFQSKLLLALLLAAS